MKRNLLQILFPVLFLGMSFPLSAQVIADAVVALDGTGDFSSVQDAIDAAPSNNERRFVIYIKNGTYDKEKLIVPATKTNLTLVGESRDNTIISYHMHNCSSTADNPDGMCPLEDYTYWNAINADLGRTAATLTIRADGLIIENLTIENTSGNTGQAQAITVWGADKLIIRNCNLTGYQDTVYLWTQTNRAYFENCMISGRTDYIYGAGVAFFQSCEIRSYGGGWITAPSTPQDQAYGYVFNECELTFATGGPSPGDRNSKFSLGRPWHNYPKVTWMRCYMDEMLDPLGWNTTWNMEYAATSDELHLYEYENYGPGADMSGRANWVGLREITAEEAANYTVRKVMAGNDGWDPSAEAPVVTTYYWTGNSDSSWLTAGNWNPEGIPAAGEIAIIEGPTTVNADGGNFEADLYIRTDATLNITADSEVSYLALEGGKIQATSTAVLNGNVQTKAVTEFNIPGVLDFQPTLSGVQSVTKTGSGLLILSGENSNYAGLWVVAGGMLALTGTQSSGTKGVNVQNGAMLIIGAEDCWYIKSVLTIENGARVQIDQPITLNELYIDGVMMDTGEYNASTHPAVFNGPESILVGRPELFEWNPTVDKRWEKAENYKPALLPLAGETVIVTTEMEASADGMNEATILVQQSNIRLVGNTVSAGDIVMSEGTSFTYATGGTGFSLDAPVKLEGDVVMQMGGGNSSSSMIFSGSFEGDSKVTAYNYTTPENSLTKLELRGDNSHFTGTWTTRDSRVQSSSVVIEGNAANAFGKGTIEIGTNNYVYFSHASASGEDNTLILHAGAKAVLNTDATIGTLILAGEEQPHGTYSSLTRSDYLEGSGILTVLNGSSGIRHPEIQTGVYFDGYTLTSSFLMESVKIFDMQGRSIKQIYPDAFVTTLGLAKGIYLIEVKAGNETVHTKIVHE